MFSYNFEHESLLFSCVEQYFFSYYHLLNYSLTISEDLNCCIFMEGKKKRKKAHEPVYVTVLLALFSDPLKGAVYYFHQRMHLWSSLESKTQYVFMCRKFYLSYAKLYAITEWNFLKAEFNITKSVLETYLSRHPLGVNKGGKSNWFSLCWL